MHDFVREDANGLRGTHAEVPVLLHEAGRAVRETEHVVHHQDLAIAVRPGPYSDQRNIQLHRNLTAERCAEIGVRRVDKDTLFRTADVVSVHLLLSERTRGLVGARELAQMKPTAYLVNTSRGPIVDEAALVRALEDRAIAGAGLDVFDVEPLPRDHVLRRLDNAVLTGHTGYVVKELYAKAYGDAVENVAAWRNGRPVRVLNAG